MPRMATAFGQARAPLQSAAERTLLLSLQRQALQYFIDNQLPHTGLVLDRQRNFGPLLGNGLHSTAATGMGAMAVALASAPPYRLLSRHAAIERVRRGLDTALERLPHSHGILPHFIDSTTGAVVGNDARSTIDTAWLLAGALWAATFLRDPVLYRLAERLFNRVDWNFWTATNGLIRHGADCAGRPLPCCWDRINGETVFMYVLAAGATADRAWPASAWQRLSTFRGEAGDLCFGSADLGLFVFQYGLDLLDLHGWHVRDDCDLMADAVLATEANARVCRAAAGQFATYRRFWGLSAGDGPGDLSGTDTYRCYAPGFPLDGTAHISAALASLAHRPALVWENLQQAQAERHLPFQGRYGFSNVNLDRQWVGQDMVGIDAGAVVLALDNCLMADRIRSTFHAIDAVQNGLERIGRHQIRARVRLRDLHFTSRNSPTITRWGQHGT